MTLRDAITSDASVVFTSTDDFAEVVTYYPSSGGSRSIKAVVFRDEEQPFSEDGVLLPVWRVQVVNSSTLGIAGSELDRGGDQIGFPPRDGESAARKSITGLQLQDHAMLVMECR